jgi:hypothetical protein
VNPSYGASPATEWQIVALLARNPGRLIAVT